MIGENSPSIRIFKVFNVTFLFLCTLACLIPLIHVLMASLSDPIEFVRNRGLLLKPAGFSLESYRLVLESPEVWRGYINSFFYVTCAVSLGLMLSIMGGFVISRKNLMLKNVFVMMLLITMIIPPGIIPLFLVVYNLNMIDSPLAVIIPRCVTVFGLIILRTAFVAIPDSLEESAKIDGASPFRIMFSIIIPLAKASIAVIALFYTVQHWNAFFDAMIYLRDRTLFPLQLILREILIMDVGTEAVATGEGSKELLREIMKYSTIMVSIIPMLIAYPFIQRHFTKGIMIGAVKG